MVELAISSDIRENRGKRRFAGAQDPCCRCQSENHVLKAGAGRLEQLWMRQHVQPLAPCALFQTRITKSLGCELDAFLRESSKLEVAQPGELSSPLMCPARALPLRAPQE